MQTPKFWYTDDNFGTWILSLLLMPLSWLYYRISKEVSASTKPYKIDIPVICVGNLVAGGAGKTPSTIALAKLLKAQGRNPHILSRGYKGSVTEPTKVNPETHNASQVGDEPLLMAKEGLTVWVSKNRKKSAHLAKKDGADILLMDDGFQNRGLTKSFSFLAYDGLLGFGNHRLIPSGPLREPVQEGLKRAQAMLQIGDDFTGGLNTVQIPKIRADFVPLSDELAGQRVYPFAGMGRPEKFLRTLHLMGCDIAGFDMFPDHYSYREMDLKVLITKAEKQEAVLVTTRKDYYRIPEHLKESVKILDVELVFEDEQSVLNLIEPILKEKPIKKKENE